MEKEYIHDYSPRVYQPAFIFRFLGLLTLSVILFACDGECFDTEPTEGEVTVVLNREQVRDTILIEIYFGDWENGDLKESWDVWSEDFTVWLPTNRYYSFVAHYPTENGLVRVIDGTEMETYESGGDYESCWHIRNDVVYLQLMQTP